MSSLEKRKEGMGPGEYEQKAVEAGFVRVCGCDEAGAGPLAGPVYAAAVILAQGADIPGLNDSKKLTEKKREALFPLIQQSALAWSVARVEAEEIDRTDILSARIRAMQLAIEGLSLRPDFALIDGNRDHGRSAAITGSPLVRGERGQHLALHRRRLHSGQGEPGPLHAGDGGALSTIRVRAAQGVRDPTAL